MAASSSTASSACTTGHSDNNQWCQVFINHRGVDVKRTLARSLYIRLGDNGLRAFLDEEELRPGYDFPSQLESAIKAAEVHVAIFSPRYAESQWCLDELVMMLESKAPIVPVFYDVTPGEVRWTHGEDRKYAQALKELAEKRTHEGTPRYDSKRIENWRNALCGVAGNSGFELERWNGEKLELELVDKVVKRLLEMVKKPDLHVAKFPTGLGEKLEDFEKTVMLHEKTVMLQQQQSGKPRIFGIVGLCGIGKTTLAKEIFNKKRCGYDKSCFLSDIKDNADKGSLTSLQRILVRSLIGLDKPVDSVDEGKGMLKEPLKSCKVLLILDDVDDVNQVEALLPVQTDNLHKDSLILFTSRDKQVLISSRVENSSIYKLTGLNRQHSIELFCNHAFNQPYPLPTFKYLVADFLKACNGLPLSLKVFGVLLYGREISDWKDELESLQQILPGDIHKAFIRSYMSLNKEEQHIFLDIACFFIGENRDTAIKIWDTSGWRGRRGFQNLQNKCLVEVDSGNAIHMHDHVRNLRIDVAEVSRPRRFWHWTKSVIDNLLSCEITVRGIRMFHDEYSGDHEEYNGGVTDTENALLESIFRRLQLLYIEHDLLERILRRVELPNLIWLSWKKCPHSSLPSWVQMKNLKVLRLTESLLSILWQKGGDSQRSPQLPVCLEELWADRSVKLKSIEGLEQLTKLRLLCVDGCCELQELPSMDKLISLEKLQAARCVKLKSIRALAPLTKLRLLCVNECSELEELPSMERLVSLEEMRAADCVKLKSIRASAQMTKLRVLDVSHC